MRDVARHLVRTQQVLLAGRGVDPGGDPTLTDVEPGRVEAGADPFGEALHTNGVCRPGTEPPADAGREARVLARPGLA